MATMSACRRETADASASPAVSDAAPRRIVSIGPNAPEILDALSVADRLVGVDTFCLLPPLVRDLPKVGGLIDPDLEKILTLQPDLIILRGQCDPVEQWAKRGGVRMYHDATESLDDIYRNVAALGALVGRDTQAEEIVSRMRAQVARIEQAVAGLDRPTVLITAARNPDRLADIVTPSTGTFLDDAIRVSGGVNAFGGLDLRWPMVGPEAIVAARPDIIIELMPETTLSQELESRLRWQWAALDTIPAVANSRIHFLTLDHAMIPSPRFVEVIEELARIIHPDAHLER